MKKRLLPIYLVLMMIVSCTPGNLEIKTGLVDEVKAETVLQNPRIKSDTSMEAGQKVTYDCVWFGSYPQTEIVDKPETSGVYGKSWEQVSDYEVAPDLYEQLNTSDGWIENTIELNGIKYCRLQKSDATYAEWVNDNICYTWNRGIDYHYFRFDRIKWRVLNVSDNQVLLMTDQAIDDQKYHTSGGDVVWETSTVRSWLNGYGTSDNTPGIDFSSNNFIDNAFLPEEQDAIITSKVINNNNSKYSTEGGNDTNDKIYFLSESEAYTASSKRYGFISTPGTIDEARRCKSSTFTKAMGAYTTDNRDYLGYCNWWLRSPGFMPSMAVQVNNDGHVEENGANVLNSFAVRPVIKIDVSSKLWVYAGTICTDEMKSPNSGKDTKPVTPSVKVSKITLAGISKQIAAGKSIQLTSTVLPKNATNKKLKWTSSNTKVATVSQTGKVKIKKGTGGKSVIITAQATDGSGKSAAFNIKVMKGAVKSIKIKGAKKTLKVGKTMKLKATVKVTKGKPVNKKVKWSSSNKKYATVSSKGVVKAQKEGKGKKVTITAMATDGTGKKKKVTIKIK